MEIAFRAFEYRADTSFQETEYEFRGSEETGWTVFRDGQVHLEVGPGYRLLRTDRCGVCSTDLDRHFLPFPLPQVTGHELVAVDPATAGTGDDRFVVEINASHAARGIDADCPFCTRGLETHCPERLVLGIHDLPGGFGSWILAPKNSILRVPDVVPSEVAVLVEPFAATLHGVHTTRPRDGDRVAVLGPRRLGMLLVAALAADRRRRDVDYEIHALVRRDEIGELARTFGADAYTNTTTSEIDDYEIVFDTTGNPDALMLAAAHATRELHIKSTHGQPSGGLTQGTAMVVDELAIDRLPLRDGQIDTSLSLANYSGRARACVVWLASREAPENLHDIAVVHAGTSAVSLRDAMTKNPDLPRADAAVVDPTGAAIDAAVRPSESDEISIVRPRGTIYVDPRAESDPGTLAHEVATRGLRISTSRCGDFRAALELLASDEELRTRLQRLVTHQFDNASLVEAFSIARSPACIKAVVQHAAP